MSELKLKATKQIKQALSRRHTAVITAAAELLVSWACELKSHFPKNSNEQLSEAKDEIWLQWGDLVGTIQSFDSAT